MKKFFNSIGKALSEYYNRQFYKDIKGFNRPLMLSYLLIFVRQIIYFLLICTGSVINKLSELDVNFSKIKELTLTEMDSSYNWSVYISSALLLAMIMLFSYSFLNVAMDLKVPFGRHILSGICMCYNYILFIPLLAVNLAMIKVHFLAIINLPFIFLFNLLIGAHDQDFRIRQQDFLAKRSPIMWDWGLTFLESLSSLCSALFDKGELILFVNFLIGIFRIINNFLNCVYNNRRIRILEQFMALLHAAEVFTLFLSVINNQAYGVSILLLLWIPITLKAGQLLEMYALNIKRIPWVREKIISFGRKNTSQNGFLIDSQLRMIYKRIHTPFENYKTNPLSVIFETFLYTHSQDCEKIEGTCPLCEYTLNSTGTIDEAYIDGLHRKKCLNAFIIEQYSAFIGKASQNSSVDKESSSKGKAFIFFSYIYFLAEIEKSKILSFVEMVRLNKQLKLTFREKMFLNDVQRNVTYQFEAAKLSEGKGIPEIESAKTADGSKRIDPEKQDYLLGIRFDEELRGIEEQYLATLKLKEKLFVYLSEDSLDLIEIKEKSINVMQMREEVRRRIKALAEIDSENQKLQFYMESYVTYLGFADKKSQLFLQNKTGHSLMQRRPKMILESDVFSKDSCVVFITLIDDIGAIRRMQNKFELLFGLDSKQSMGKNINTIMPSIIGKYHNKVLENYILKSGKNNENIKETSSDSDKTLNKQISSIAEPNAKRPNTMPLLLARNSKGWAVAVQLNFKADNISLQDCGLTGHLRIINKEYIYLMTSCRSFQVQLMSQPFFDRVLNRYVEQGDVYKIYLNQIIPLLPYFEKQWLKKESGYEEVHRDLIKTILFLPKQDGIASNTGSLLVPSFRKGFSSPLFDKVELSKLQKDIKKFSIERYDMFQIKMKFYHNSNEFTQFNIVEIQQMWKITTPNLQRDGLLLLKGQLKALLNIDYDVQSDIQILFKLEELSYYQIHASSNDPMKLTALRSSWGFEELDNEEMSEQSQEGSQDYDVRTHSPMEKRENVKKHPKETQDQNVAHKYLGNETSPHSNQKGGDVPQLEEVGNFYTNSPRDEADVSHLAEASRRSPMVSTGGNQDFSQTNPDFNSQRKSGTDIAPRNDPRFGSKTFSTIPLGGEAPNFNQSTFFDTTKGDHQEDKDSDEDKEDYEEQKNHRTEDHSNNFIQLQYDKEGRFQEHVDENHPFHNEEPPHVRLIGNINDHGNPEYKTPPIPELKKLDSAMSLLSVTPYPHLLEPTFISFAAVPLVSNLNAVPGDMIASSSFMLQQGISNRDTSPHLYSKHQQINSFQQQMQDKNQIHAQSMLQLQQVQQEQQQSPDKQYVKKHTQSQMNISSSQQQGLNTSSQQHSPHEQSLQHSPHEQSHQYSPDNQNSVNPIQSPNLQHSPNQSPQLLTPQTQATSYYGEKNKGIFYLLKEKLKELKKQKKSKSAATATTSAIGLEEQASDMWTQKNTLNFKTITHQFSSNPSFALNNTVSNNNNNNNNSQYLQSFLRSYYDISNGSMNIIGKKKKGNHELWGQHDDSVESPDGKHKKIALAEEDDHQRQGAAGYMAGQSSELGTESHDEIEHRHHEQRKLGRMQTNSVHTSQATSSEHKATIRQMIVSKHGKDRSLIQLRLFGFVAILAIVILTIYSFVNTQDLFSKAQIHIDNIPWSNTIRAVFSFPFIYMSLKSILEVDAFGDSTLYSSDFGKTLAARSSNDFYLMNNLLLELQQQGTEGRDYFSFVVNEQTYFLFSQSDSTVPTSVILTRDDSYKTRMEMSVLQFLYLTVTFNREAQQEGYKGPFLQKFVIDNFVNFITNMTTVQTQVQNQSEHVLNSISSSVSQLIILVTSVSFVLIFMIFPLYFFVQLRNEQVLKLLATIQPLTLQQMLRQISLGMFIFSLDSQHNMPNDKVLKFKTDNVRKKKNISNTTTISKFKIVHLLIALVAFGIICIQPMVTVIITQQYIDEAEVNIDLLGKLYNLIAQSASNLVVTYNYMNYQLVAAGRTYNPHYYLQRSNILVASNQNILNEVSNIIQSSGSQTKRQQSLYQKFFYKLLNTNMCEALEEYPQYIEANLFDVTTCSSISSGILTQGFQVSMKKFLESFTNLNQIFNMPDADVIPAIQTWQKVVNIRDFDLFSEFLTRSIIVQKDFLITVMTDDINYISSVSIGLLVFQVLLLGGFFSYFWLRIYHFISTEMFTIRNILTVLTIDAVVENPYVISYLTK